MIAVAAVALLTVTGTPGGCTGRAAAAPESESEAIVRVRQGESVAAASGELVVTFESVASDSRCPKGETCVWEGEGVVVISMRGSQSPPARIELRTSARGPTAGSYEGYSIRLESLEPYPVTGRTIAAADYVATLSVSRDGEVGPETQ